MAHAKENDCEALFQKGQQYSFVVAPRVFIFQRNQEGTDSIANKVIGQIVEIMKHGGQKGLKQIGIPL